MFVDIVHLACHRGSCNAKVEIMKKEKHQNPNILPLSAAPKYYYYCYYYYFSLIVVRLLQDSSHVDYNYTNFNI